MWYSYSVQALVTFLCSHVWCLRHWPWHLLLHKFSCYKSQRNEDLFCSSYLCMLFSLPLSSESWYRDLCPNHHPRQGKRGGLHNALHGLLSGRAASKGREDSGHVCLLGAIWPLPVGMHSWHCAVSRATGLPLELAQPPAPSDGIHDLHHPLQLHVVCVRILCATR